MTTHLALWYALPLRTFTTPPPSGSGTFRDGERLEHGHSHHGAKPDVVVAEHGDPSVVGREQGEGAAPLAAEVVAHLVDAVIGDNGGSIVPYCSFLS